MLPAASTHPTHINKRRAALLSLAQPTRRRLCHRLLDLCRSGWPRGSRSDTRGWMYIVPPNRENTLISCNFHRFGGMAIVSDLEPRGRPGAAQIKQGAPQSSRDGLSEAHECPVMFIYVWGKCTGRGEHPDRLNSRFRFRENI